MQYFFKPVISTGLFFLLFIYSDVFASSITETLYQYLFPSHYSTHFVSDSTFIEIKSHYDNIITLESEYPSKDSSFTLDISSHQATTIATLAKKSIGLNLLIQNHGLDIEMNRLYTKRSNKKLQSTSLISEISITPWIKKDNFSMGIEIGKSFSPDYYRDQTDLFSQQLITELMKNREVIFGAFANFRYKIFDLHISDSRRVISAQTPEYKYEKTGNSRSAPLSLIQNQLNAEIGVNIKSARLFSAFKRYHLYSDSLTKGVNGLPFVTDWYLNDLYLGGKISKFNLSLNYGWGSGYINGYDSDQENASRYLILNDLEIKKSFSKFTIDFTKNINTSLFFEYLSFKLPNRGYLDFYPFSFWTIFKPMAYRLSDGNFSLVNSGINFCATKKWRPFTSTNLELTPSFFKVKSNVKQEKKKIVVFFPVYTNDTLVSPIDTSGILIDIKLSQQFNISKFKIDLGVEQLIPILLKQKEEKVSINNPDDGNSDDNGNPDDGNNDNGDNTDNETPVPDEKADITKSFGLNTIFLNITYRF